MTSTRTRLTVVAAVVLTIALATVVSPWASPSPDGLERVAIDQGFDASATEHALADSPAADYQVGVGAGEAWATAAAGLLGVVVTSAAGAGLVAAVRRRSHRHDTIERAAVAR